MNSAWSCIILIACVAMTIFYGWNFYLVCRNEAKIDAVRLIGFYLTAVFNAVSHVLVAIYFVEYHTYGNTIE